MEAASRFPAEAGISPPPPADGAKQPVSVGAAGVGEEVEESLSQSSADSEAPAIIVTKVEDEEAAPKHVADSSGDGDDDDDTEGEHEERFSFVRELEEEEEPQWVASFALLSDVSDGQEQRLVQTRDEAVAVIKDLWGEFTWNPPSHAPKPTTAEPIFTPGQRQTKAAAKKYLYERFLSDVDRAPRMVGGKTWLDKDALVHLRGLVLLVQHPDYLDHLSGLRPQPVLSRGVRLVVPSSTHMMQEALAAAVAHAVGAVLVVVDHRRIAGVRRAAFESGVPKRFLTTEVIVTALLEASRESTHPLVVFLADKGRPIFQSKAACEVLQQEFKSKTSSTFFLLSSEFDPDSPQQVGMPFHGGNMTAANPFDENSMSGLARGVPPMIRPPSPDFMPPKAPHVPVLNIFIKPGLVPMPPGARPPNVTMPQGPMMPLPPSVLRNALSDILQRVADEINVNSGPSSNQNNAEGEEEEKDEDDGDEDDEDEEPNMKDVGPKTAAQFARYMLDLMKDENFNRHLEGQMALGTFLSEQASHHNQPNNGYMITVSLPPPFLPGMPPPPNAPRPPNMPMQGQQTGPQSGGFPKFWWPPIKSIISPGEAKANETSKQQQQQQAPPSGRSSQKRKNGRNKNVTVVAPPEGTEIAPTDAETEGLLGFFEEVVINPSSDQAIRASWDRFAQEDRERFIAKKNYQILEQALMQGRLYCPEFKRTNPLLYKVNLKGQSSKILLTALELEVSRQQPLPEVSPPDVSGVGEGEPESGNEPYLLLSLSALETALAMVCKTDIPRTGNPVSRTKEEVASLAQNRHEAALVAHVISPQDIGVTYDQIGGLSEVKETLRQCVTYPLRFPHLYSEGIAADSIKGVLLFGPPGTGKTMLAKAVATEGGATFLSIDASAIESKWLGESEKNAKAVFTLARRLAPCVIYLDEVDSILSSRDTGEDSKFNTITSVKTTIMQEWDGLRTTSDRVIVVASTNRPYALDQAVLRRLPRRILVDLPDQATREEMLGVIMANNRMAPDVNLTAIARKLDGYTGSDIREVCREAVVQISHEESRKLDQAQGLDLDVLTKRLRPVTNADFTKAMEKLSASVSSKGRELERVREWNNQYGENRKRQRPPHLSMYL